MTALEKQAAVKRISTIRYLDVDRLNAQVSPLRPDKEFDLVVVGRVRCGRCRRSAASPVLATREWSIARSLISKTRPRGLFELLAGKPLTADELKPVPNTAMFAIALRLDPLKSLRNAHRPRRQSPILENAERFKQTTAGMAQAFGFRLREDVLGSLGDVWTIHGGASQRFKPIGRPGRDRHPDEQGNAGQDSNDGVTDA